MEGYIKITVKKTENDTVLEGETKLNASPRERIEILFAIIQLLEIDPHDMIGQLIVNKFGSGEWFGSSTKFDLKRFDELLEQFRGSGDKAGGVANAKK